MSVCHISIHESQFGDSLTAGLRSLSHQGFSVFEWGAMDKDRDIWSEVTIRHTSLEMEKIKEAVRKALECVKYDIE